MITFHTIQLWLGSVMIMTAFCLRTIMWLGMRSGSDRVSRALATLACSLIGASGIMLMIF